LGIVPRFGCRDVSWGLDIIGCGHLLPALTREDFGMLVMWLATPHVSRWWTEPASLLDVEERYGPSVDGSDPTRIYMVVCGAAPIGMIQSYWIDDYPHHAETMQLPGSVGIDFFIGDSGFIGRGIGPQMLIMFLDTIIPPHTQGRTAFASDPSVHNAVSIRALEKAGFGRGRVVQEETGLEQIMVRVL